MSDHASPTPVIEVDDGRVTIRDLTVDDPTVAALLLAVPRERWPEEVAAALSVGARGMSAMGGTAVAHQVGEVVEQILVDTARRAEAGVTAIVQDGRRAIADTLDPEVRTSVTARTMRELEMLHGRLLTGLDPAQRDSHTARFVQELDALLGPAGPLQARLTEAFDPAAPSSAVSRMLATVEQRFRELRDLVVGVSEREAEADRGTAKGVAFEDLVEARLRTMAGRIGGCVVERTSLQGGALGAAALVGDLVLTLTDGTRVAVEVKNTGRISLTGRDGILEELDTAMANREAEWAICVSRNDAFPNEVGAFGVYGRRVLVVDDGDGELLEVALRWVSAAASAAAVAQPGLDLDAVGDGVERLGALATRFSRAKKALAGVRSNVDLVRSELDALRTDLVSLVDELRLELRRVPEAVPVTTRVA